MLGKLRTILVVAGDFDIDDLMIQLTDQGTTPPVIFCMLIEILIKNKFSVETIFRIV